MRAERPAYDHLIESLADGVPLDWGALAANAETAVEQRRYRNLRLVARIAELHRTIAIEADAAVTAEEADAVEPNLTTWGHLEIKRRIAVGSFGNLYLAHDPQLSRDVALKLLRRRVSDRALAGRLLTEAQTLAKVRHPNVVTVHGADVRDGRAGLWMELVNGKTLEAWLLDNGPLGASETMAIGQDLCRALAAVHAAGLVHGDVKAQNVMREQGGRIVLMDFGAGQVQGAAGAVAGTPLYLAPEVLAGAPSTVRSDIYSLGVLLFHLLTNQYPCSAPDIDGLRLAHAQGVRVRLRDLRPDLTAPLVEAVERSLEPDPAMRFATAGTMERALGGSARDLGRGIHWAIGALVAAAALVALVVSVPRLGRTLVAPRVGSIAVMPFVPAAGEDSVHLLEGLSTDVIRELQRFDIEVKRASASTVSDPRVLQQRLNADAMVRGSSSRADGTRKLRVAVIRAGARDLWAGEYGLEDVALPSLARTIAQEIATALRIGVRPGAPGPGHQTNYRAYDAYLRGRMLSEKRTPADLMRSLDFFKQAAALDPDYAEPWAGMSDSYMALGVPPFGGLRPVEARRLAKEAALAALDRDPNLAEAHTSLAWAAALYDWDWTAAETRFKRALDLNPQYSLAHHWYAMFLTDMGRFDEATAAMRRAEALEPLSLLIHRDVAWIAFCRGRYDEAIAQLRQTLQRDPGYAAALTLLARALAATGHHDEALAELEKARADISPGSYLSFRGYIEALAGDPRASETLAELRRISATEYVTPYYFALIHAALGQRQAALTELERAYVEQDATLGSINVDPRFQPPLRADPRFEAIIARMRFPSRQ